MRDQIEYKPQKRLSSTPLLGPCLAVVLWGSALVSLSACSPQFKVSTLSAENLIQDPELFAENTPEYEVQAEAAPELKPEPETETETEPGSGTESQSTSETNPSQDTPVEPKQESPREEIPTETAEAQKQPTPAARPLSHKSPEESRTEPTAETTTTTITHNPENEQKQELDDVIVVTPTETNGGTWFYLTKEFSVQDVEIDEQQNAIAVEKPQKIELMIEMKNFIQSAKENSSVETSVSADLGLNRLVELKTSFTRNAPRRIFKRGRWHIQAECQFHPTENKCEMVSYLVHVKFSFDRKSNPPQPQVHVESALAFYVLESSESVVHYKILPSSFRNFTELVAEMKSHANQEK